MRTQKLPEKILPFRQSSPASNNGCRGAPVSLQTWGRRDICPQSRAGGPRWSSRGSPPVGPALPPPTGGAGGDAGQHSLGPDKLPPSLEGVLIPYTDNLVVDRTIQGLGNKIGPNALYAVRAGWPPDSRGEASGSTATTLILGSCSFKYRPVPDKVPPVPTVATKISTFPSVSRQISGPVVW